ncbi:MAG: phage holin family protein [Vulcanimicrobiaceae bacterium]
MVDQTTQLHKRPTPELIVRLLIQVGALCQGEFALAQRELGSKVRGLALSGLLAGAAVVFAILGTFALLITLIALLRVVVPLWAAALIVMAALFVLAALFALAAKSLIAGAAPLLPERTIKSLKETYTWAKTQLPSSNE